MPAVAQATESVPELIRRCQLAFNDENYDVALDIANTAVRASKHDPNLPPHTRVTVFDLRARLRTKLEEYDLALKDGKKMIRIDRADGRGYYRCAEIERFRRNPAGAATFCEYGLKHVACTDRYSRSIAKTLAAVQKEMRDRIVLTSPGDPMTALPLEVAVMILSNIPYRQQVKMLRVCKAWYQLLESLSPLIDTVAFPDASKAVTVRMLHATLRRLKQPKIVSARHLDEAATEYLNRALLHLRVLSKLQHLEIHHKSVPIWQLPLPKYDLRSIMLGPDTETPFDFIPTILKDCPKLRVAKFKHVTGSELGETYLDRKSLRLESETLRVLHIHIPVMTVEFEHDTLFSGLPELESLFCVGLSCFQGPARLKSVDIRHMKQLESLELERCTMPAIVLPSSVRRLRFDGVTFDEYSLQVDQTSPPDPRSTNYSQLENLESLIVFNCPRFPKFVHDAGQTAKAATVEDFRILLRTGSLPSLLFQTAWSKGFRRVHVTGSCVDDASYKVFLEYCPALEELSLDGARITGLFIGDFLRARPPKLRKITLRNCNNVPNDVVAWAKHLGVEVDMTRSVQESGGRRVRYGD
ncbi:hypothetical protein A1O3_10488 [Capronia epimyces CBS 606.96]|uniref:F-box domain-containing protein n=1 Tax=Capronia epimyces CBS 606.96 TaxID=1182542 RepID=W9X9G5_9EURO|nr:uncharacterized protein A1O3_10488 [Capronia epimyces CBS 606.96]EXJ76843.1 hypothetical protein A1O3_10488 [Capronia epimyces CBS 606.96]